MKTTKGRKLEGRKKSNKARSDMFPERRLSPA